MRILLNRFAGAADAFNEYLGRALSYFLPVMVTITLVIIICATVFRIGWVWLQETVTYMHAILFTLAAAYTLRHDEHVRMDVFYIGLSKKNKAWVNLCGVLFMLTPTCIVTIFYAVPYVRDSWSVFEHSMEGDGLPAVFLLKTCIPIMAALLLLQGAAIAAKALLIIFPPTIANTD
ncbi:TRAP transporter small permease subunit [Candidatus Persebacteraceae bacterium Df01]|jgi:TRAP-type mannitol/chloroaromatic compound transport system permease small subunit|uniref:TRAP transporter small permease protein n=1 Tax=Candidatus Doriopsillibacter californiensis TaxID=2970740 RepID=A0ABT7QMI4_9GAMM|nr:TRAP transporter small permease subunit [Candidatus Persebacteraceae bacterium Df01]